ncbi:hypothetical protein [Haliangium ochraceum]|uniref:hypothetical protein n=1 Tax=Haliangium ochraceum TaxID=80816 RepID=UPI001269B7CD|nr:hypothetical protein [Haliangium ochraceum]
MTRLRTSVLSTASPLLLAGVLLGTGSVAQARPGAPAALCQSYGDADVCQGRLPTCATCHTSTAPVSWNAYGDQVRDALAPGRFDEALADALRAIELDDADGDGVANLDELMLGTEPGDAGDAWPYCESEQSYEKTPSASPLAAGYDFARAFKRIRILYCGQSPSYDELRSFAELAAGPDGPDGPGRAYDALHDELARCLDSAYWRDQALVRLADPRVRPVFAVGASSPIGLIIGDYEYDYRLFSYVMTGDRDVRDLLLADYHVERADDGALVPVQGVIAVPPDAPEYGGSGQPLVPERRAGMITTQWFLAINTMFSAVPRTTAAQAMRAYLGADIAKEQGIWPIPGEPVDVDEKGVDAPQCASCHSTLDPLSYAFAYYEGIVAEGAGAYNPARPAQLIPGWRDNQGMLFGEPVRDLNDWAARAVESDDFARNLVHMLFIYSFEREPTPGELGAFQAIWRSLDSDGWSANRILHRIVDLPAFGGAL